MKRWLLAIIILLIPGALADTVFPKPVGISWYSEETFECKLCCTETERFSVKTTINNMGTERLLMGKAKLVDNNGQEFALYHPPDPNTLYDIQSTEKFVINYQGNWPTPINNKIVYKQCIYLEDTEEWVCEEEYKEELIAKKADVECYYDYDCPNDYICNLNDCLSTTCEKIRIAEECGRIVVGTWRPYECCQDEECKFDQECVEHSCENVECKKWGYIADHRCIEPECCADIDCSPIQKCEKSKCIDIECRYCEYIESRQCMKYECCKSDECGENQACNDNVCEDIECVKGYIENHECIKYPCTKDNECRKNMVCEENICMILKCEDDQIRKDHQCISIGPTPFGYIKDNTYIAYISKEAYKDNKDAYAAMSMIIIVILLGLSTLITKPKAKHLKRKRSYIVIKHEKKH
ncbi:MAG: hypothetical protein KKA79_04765 [Nanoarchaeota archaeon]|nr:hypothetical protein [Nanoarchaeota archaeon]MCG2717852.1 hypothetical protein [Nanoarchaeota archaeon]